MTAAKATIRRRRTGGAGAVPRELAEWFGGAPALRRPLQFKLPHTCQVARLWAAWSADNPGARAPLGWEWLADPADPRHVVPRALQGLVNRLTPAG